MGNKKIVLPCQKELEVTGKAARFSAAKYLADTRVRGAVEQMYSGLPFPHRFVLLMYYYEELSREDISFVMGVSEETVDRLLSGSKKRMLQSLKSYTKETTLLCQFPKMVSAPVMGRYFREDAAKISPEEIARVLQRIEL